MTQFFQAHVAIDLQMNEEGLERYANLSQSGFAENKYILLQTALAQYHARGDVYDQIFLIWIEPPFPNLSDSPDSEERLIKNIFTCCLYLGLICKQF